MGIVGCWGLLVAGHCLLLVDGDSWLMVDVDCGLTVDDAIVDLLWIEM